MIRKLLAALAAFVLTTGPATAKPASPPSLAAQQARAFVEGIYQRVVHDEQYCATCGEFRGQVFDVSTVAMLEEDDRLAGGEVGALDFDPFCDCQDTGGLVASVISVRLTSKTTARVVVGLNFVDAEPDEHGKVVVLLVRTPAGWRVHDVISRDGTGMRETLRYGDEEIRKYLARGGT